MRMMIGLTCSGVLLLMSSSALVAAASETQGCPSPSVWSRMQQHQMQAGETVQGLAKRYGLLPTTLMGLNPALKQGQAPVGLNLKIPPFDGIVVAVPADRTLQDVAQTYRIRADVLFEINGCQTAPRRVFVPGVNWSPLLPQDASGVVALAPPTPAQPLQALQGDRYPLPQQAEVIGAYGWRVNPATQQVTFFSGVDLSATAGTPVLAVAAGTVAFAGDRGDGIQQVVINHTQGRQTRYAQLQQLRVKTGQSIKRGTVLGLVQANPSSGFTGLRFEVRQRSSLGWVAQDPRPYLSAIARNLR